MLFHAPRTPPWASRLTAAGDSSLRPAVVEERRRPYPSPEAESSSSKNTPLAQFPFFKNYGAEKKTTRDGQPPKRRGPKPDSKPALTRRQELNRQAQRTHRERKEMYIKALEQEVLRLKELYTTSTKERDAIVDENRRLKELLAMHGIAYDLASPPVGMGGTSSYGGSSSRGSLSGSYNPGSASTGYTSPPAGAATMGIAPPPPQQQQAAHAAQQQQVDYAQVGIDFVLTLEKPCMDHMPYLLERSASAPDLPSGHALMATHHQQDTHTPPTAPDSAPPANPSPPADLLKLLDLANRLPIMEGEITPVMAWASILRDERVRRGGLGRGEFEWLRGELGGKVRCYGFGAVLEDFEVRDALSSVFAAKCQIGGGGVGGGVGGVVVASL
ncbi:uncharacterized protein K452DRAFT_323648 [Aplosporella prunicola CBS 121167]|uniref:BZIP domain-containing protein n=1 Tax=Aplosporella prunicola CBS 121167 TaxID=1176127 RepID=A0A6A6BT93_9PEZI|nr:uncharacterized protein K452DRAFT_323648 [Aplosporella prunicola CBS 121167]KAF2146464.1 hypothetical protein K452DRAFT_323648 [Aplosporella prunicola CBS 121167]